MVRQFTPRRAWGFLEEEYARTFRHDYWNIGVVDAPIHAFLDPPTVPPVQWLPPPDPTKYHADPFGLNVGGVLTIVFEEFDLRSGKGSISWVRENRTGSFSEPRRAIELPFHTSYPFLVESSGSVFALPEMAEGNEIGVYRAIDFPGRWTKHGTLVRGVRGMDSTVVEHDGGFWLFCTDASDNPFSRLKIWHAPDLFGPWRAHAANPVKADARSARPAGTPFVADGELYRPAQDCSRTYGGSITINRVVELTPTRFREEPVARVTPVEGGAYPHGIHTLSAVGDRTLVDGKRFGFSRSEMARNLRESLADRWPEILRR